MKKLFLLFCLIWIVSSGKASAQVLSADSIQNRILFRNSVYLELLGNAQMGSLNYERLFPIKGSSEVFALRGGGMYWPLGKSSSGKAYELFIPLEATIFWGKKKLKPEVGLGFTYEIFSESDYDTGKQENSTSLMPVLRFGFRYIVPENKWFLRVGFTPLFIDDAYLLPPVMPWIGLSFGYSFGKK